MAFCEVVCIYKFVFKCKYTLRNRTNGIYALTGFSKKKKKTSLGWQIFHQVVPFCQVAVFSFKHTQMLCVKVAPGKPQTGRAKIKITPDTGEEKIHWVGFHWVCHSGMRKLIDPSVLHAFLSSQVTGRLFSFSIMNVATGISWH